MKKALAIFGLLVTLHGSANPVTFCVDMRYWAIDPGGIHLYVAGDTVFHPMTRSVGDTNIYCITLDLPADSCIEYDFLNGSDFYGLEFVPPESRVDDINSNRWICTHAGTTDTLETGALLFAANAPEGLTLLRLKVDMVQEPVIDPSGVYVSGAVGTNVRMANLHHGTVYDAMAYLIPGAYDYRFYNGSVSETVPVVCSVNANRPVTLNIDTLVPAVCYSDCIACGTGIEPNLNLPGSLVVFPNPATENFQLNAPVRGAYRLGITDLSGKTVREYALQEHERCWYGVDGLPSGTYLVTAYDATGQPLDCDRLIIR